MQLMGSFWPDALPFGNRYARDPDDFFEIGNDRQIVTQVARDMGIDEDVLQSLRLRQAEWPHAVAWLAGAYRERQLHEVAVEMANLISGLEAGRVAATGGRKQGMDRGVAFAALALRWCWG